MGIVDLSGDVSFADGLLQCVLAVGSGHALLGRPQIGPVLQRRRLKVFHVALHRLVIERAGHVIVRRDRFVAQQLAQVRESLHPGELRRRHVRLELQHLQLDLQQIAFADVASFVPGFADIHCVLEALEVLLASSSVDSASSTLMNRAATLKARPALIVGDLRARHGRHIPGGLQAVLPLFASFEQVADAQVELRRVVEVIRAELAGWKIGRNCQSLKTTGFGRRFAVISSAWLCWIVVRAARRLWLCRSAIWMASSSEMITDAGFWASA